MPDVPSFNPRPATACEVKGIRWHLFRKTRLRHTKAPSNLPEDVTAASGASTAPYMFCDRQSSVVASWKFHTIFCIQPVLLKLSIKSQSLVHTGLTPATLMMTPVISLEFPVDEVISTDSTPPLPKRSAALM